MAVLAAVRRTSEECHRLHQVLRELASSSGRSKHWSTGNLGMLVSQYHEIIRDMAKSCCRRSSGAFWRTANYIISKCADYTERMHGLANNDLCAS